MKKKVKKDRKKNDGFTQVPNSFMWDTALTLEEKAFITILVSNKKDWVTRITEIYSRSNNSPASQRRVVKSLIAKGYLKRTDSRKGSGKTFDYKYQFSFAGGLGIPGDKPCDGFPHTETPRTESPNAESPSMEVPPTETRDTNETKLNNTNRNNINQKEIKEIKTSISKESHVLQEEKKQGFTPPTLEEVQQFFESNGSTASLALVFFKEFNERDWQTTKGDRVNNWQALAKYSIKATPKADSGPTKGLFLKLMEKDVEQIKKWGQGFFDKLSANITAQKEVTGGSDDLSFSAEDVIYCLFQVCSERKFSTAKALGDYIMKEVKQIDRDSFEGFKISMGLKSTDSPAQC